MKIMGPEYGNAPIELVEKHKELAIQMGKLFEVNSQDPKLFELQKQAQELEAQILEFNRKFSTEN